MNKERIVYTKILHENELAILSHCMGFTEFNGCQCNRDCTCNEDFISEEFEFYSVKRKNGRTTRHVSLEDANKRMDYVCSLPPKTHPNQRIR